MRLAPIKLERNQDGRIIEIQEVKISRQYPDDLPALSVHYNVLSHRAWIFAESFAPVPVDEHRGIRCARQFLLFSEASSKHWRNAQYRQHPVRNAHSRH